MGTGISVARRGFPGASKIMASMAIMKFSTFRISRLGEKVLTLIKMIK
jgi:hypothetical protein